MRTTALLPGESIRGERIAYRAGKVTYAAVGRGVELTLGRNVDAVAVVPLALTSGRARPFSAFTRLEARAARGACDKHEPDRAKSSSGGHTNFTGKMRGDAELGVTIPHPGQR